MQSISLAYKDEPWESALPQEAGIEDPGERGPQRNKPDIRSTFARHVLSHSPPLRAGRALPRGPKQGLPLASLTIPKSRPYQEETASFDSGLNRATHQKEGYRNKEIWPHTVAQSQTSPRENESPAAK